MKLIKFAVFAVLLVVSVGFVMQSHGAEERPTGTVSEAPKENSTFNILLMGCDESGLRPDSIMVLHVDGADGKLALLSLPRDSKVLYEGRNVKLNTLLALTHDEGKTQAIENLIGVNIDYYIKMKVGVFARIVDALGGLEYNVEQDMHYSDPAQDLYIDLKAGEQTLSGDECEQYCRYRRYVLGDLTRTQNQQRLLGELLRQKMQLRYVTKLPAVFHILRENTVTDITAADVASYLPLARSLAASGVQITAFDCPGEYNDMKKEGISYYQIDQKALYNLCQNHFKTP